MSAILTTKNLTKDFGGGRGLFDLNVSVQPGEIVGFVGPNGAGKSTTISLLAGNIKPTRGTVTIFDKDVTPNSVYRVAPRIGLLLSEPTLEAGLTAAEAFRQSELLLGIKNSQWQHLSDFLELDTQKTIRELSLGNRKKVGVVMALLHEPDLLIMDEPTASLDPLMQAKFAELLKQVAARGGAVLLSSHDLTEVEHLCSRILMIKHGKLIIDSPLSELLQQGTRKFTIHKASKGLLAKLQTAAFTPDAASTLYSTIVMTRHYQKLIELLVREKHFDFYVESPSLEEMFSEYYHEARA